MIVKKQAVVLIGHGGVPTDFPRDKVRRLMMLERSRRERGERPSEEERTLEHSLRHHPRTPTTDPYQHGLERVGEALAQHVPDKRLYLAYNEFCAPSVPEAVARAVADGAQEITLVTTMLTPGGSHAEQEIPELVAELREKHPEIELRYAWPVPVDALAGFLAAHLEAF